MLLLELELWSLAMAVGVLVSGKTRERLLRRNDWTSIERNRLVIAW